MAAKRVRLSDDNGTTWNTLPGNSASMNDETGEIDDTIFGQDWQSTQTGLIGASINANGLYKGFAGYVVDLKQVSGSATSTTGEAMTLVSGLTYRINDTSKEIWDRSVTPVIYDNASPVAAADIESFDYLFGQVTFVAGYTVVGSITCDVDYFGTAAIASSRSFTLTQTANAIDNTDIPTAQANNGHRTYEPGLRTVSLEISTVYDVANAFRTALVNRAELLVEINPDGNNKSRCRGFFKYTGREQSGDVGNLEEETITMSLAVPFDEKLAYPFQWDHAVDTTLATALQIALTAWQGAGEIDVQYLPDGSTGLQGNCIITDVTLSGGLEDMNDFAITAMITGAPTTV